MKQRWKQDIALGFPIDGLAGVKRFIKRTGHFLDVLQKNDKMFRETRIALPYLWIRLRKESEREEIGKLLADYRLRMSFHNDDRGVGHQKLFSQLRYLNPKALIGIIDDDMSRTMRAFFDPKYAGKKKVLAWLKKHKISFYGNKSCTISGLTNVILAFRYCWHRAKIKKVMMFGLGKGKMFYSFSANHQSQGHALPTDIDLRTHVGQAIFFVPGCPAYFDLSVRMGYSPQQYSIDTVNVQKARENGYRCAGINDIIFMAPAAQDNITKCKPEQRPRRVTDYTITGEILSPKFVIPLVGVRQSVRMLQGTI